MSRREPGNVGIDGRSDGSHWPKRRATSERRKDERRDPAGYDKWPLDRRADRRQQTRREDG